jgi:hypothetical protein
LRVAERAEASVVPFEEVKEQIRRRLTSERSAAEYEKYVENLRETAVINIRVREVPLDVSLPEAKSVAAPAAPAASPSEAAGAETPIQSPFGAVGLPDLADELSVTPQDAPEKVSPQALPGTQPAPPEPEPTPTPSPE